MHHRVETFEGRPIDRAGLRIPARPAGRNGGPAAERDRLVSPGGQRRGERPAEEAGRAADQDAQSRYSVFFLRYPINAPSRSIGTGKIVVELFSVAISASVWR